MNSRKQLLRTAIVPLEEASEVPVACSSPPCFLHELDPTYLGYLGREEVTALLRGLLAAEPFGTPLEAAWMRCMLRRHLTRLGEVPEPEGDPAKGAVPSTGGPAGSRKEGLASQLRSALPRLHDDALRHDLADLLAILEHGARQPRRRNPA